MAATKIVQYPSLLLTKRCEPATPDVIAHVVHELLEVLRGAGKRAAVGLAANQIGHSVRIFVLDKRHLKLPHGVFVNPVITSTGQLCDTAKEGCMSFPEIVEIPVTRPIRCTVQAWTANGEEFTVDLEGLAARAALHEMDHLEGRTILSYAGAKQKRIAMQKVINAMKGKK